MLQIFGRSAFFDDVSKLSLMSEKFARGLNHEYNKRPKGDDQRQIMDHINSASPALSDRSTSRTLSRTSVGIHNNKAIPAKRDNRRSLTRR